MDNFADLGTKFLAQTKLTFLRRKCGILLPGEEKIVIEIHGDKVKTVGAVATVVAEPCEQCGLLRAALHALTR